MTYRILQPGEVVQEGDEMRWIDDPRGEVWILCLLTIGYAIDTQLLVGASGNKYEFRRPNAPTEPLG